MAFVASEEHISFATYNAVTCFLLHDGDGSVSDTITFVMMRWLYMTFVPVLVPDVASMSCAIDD